MLKRFWGMDYLAPRDTGMARILLFAAGSWGDVHPIVGLALALRERGHEVSLSTNPYFAELFKKHQLRFFPVGTAETYLETIQEPDLWHPRKAFSVVARKAINPHLQSAFDVYQQHFADSETILVAPLLAVGARVLHECFQVPLATVHLQPVGLRSVYETPVLPGVPNLRFFPKWLKRWLYWYADKAVIDPEMCPPLNRFRAELGLSPVRRPMEDWWYSPQLNIGLFPDWFAPIQPDWPENFLTTNFPQYDQGDIADLTREAQQFLAAGEPPIVFTPGSAMRHGEQFFQTAIRACEKLNRRGMLLTRYPKQLPQQLPETVLHCSYLPFSKVLPRCAAIVHHGGIGTMAQGFAAGIPQLVMPMAHDQPDNAHRLRRLGVGDFLWPQQFTTNRVAAKLNAILTNDEIQQSCAQLAEKSKSTEGLTPACEAIEQLSLQHSS